MDFWILISPFFHLGNDVHWSRWCVFEFGCLLTICWHLKNHIHWSAVLAFFVTSMNCIYFGFWRKNYLYEESYRSVEITEVQNLANQSFVAMSFMCLAIYLNRERLHTLLISLTFVHLINSFLSIIYFLTGFSFLWDKTMPLIGLFGNSSMGACFAAMLIPYFLHNFMDFWKLWIAPLVSALILIYLSQSSVAYIMAFVGCISYLFFVWREKLWVKSLSCSFLLGLCFLAGPLFDYQFFRFMQIDRIKSIWPFYFNWWWDQGHFLMGQGFGSFMSFGPGIQMHYKFQLDRGLNVWLHNDWLQILFELGFLGLLSYLVLAGFCLVKSIGEKRYELTSCVIVYILFMAGNYPTQLPLFGFFGLILVGLILQKNNSNWRSNDGWHLWNQRNW